MVMDEDIGKDDKVGETKIKLSSLCMNGGMDDWFEISHKGKKAGQIHLKGQWFPTGQIQNTMLGMGQMAGFYQAQPMVPMQQMMMQQPYG